MKICKVPGCPDKCRALGYCNKHYIRLERTGKLTLDNEMPESLPNEEWKTIEKHENYEISTHGRVKNKTSNRLIKTQKSRRNYYQVQIGRKNVVRIHMEMAKAFLKNPYNDKRIIFKDGNNDNLLISNMAWFTVSRRNNFLAQLHHADSNEKCAIIDFLNGNNLKLDKIIRENYKDFKYAAFYKIKKSGRFPAPDLVEECVQGGLLRALEALKKGNLKNVSNLVGWIATIIRNFTVNFLLESNKYISENQMNSNGDTFNLIDFKHK